MGDCDRSGFAKIVAYKHTCIQTYKHTCINTYRECSGTRLCKDCCIQTYMHTYIQGVFWDWDSGGFAKIVAYKHTYIHTYRECSGTGTAAALQRLLHLGSSLPFSPESFLRFATCCSSISCVSSYAYTYTCILHTAILIIIEGQFQAFQRVSSSKLVLKTVESCFVALNYYENGSTHTFMHSVLFPPAVRNLLLFLFCMSSYMHVISYIHVRAYTYIHTHMYIFARINMYIFPNSIYTHMYVYINTYTCSGAWNSYESAPFLCLVCIHMSTRTYIYTHTYIHT